MGNCSSHAPVDTDMPLFTQPIAFVSIPFGGREPNRITHVFKQKVKSSLLETTAYF
jgi:hypothetical protein